MKNACKTLWRVWNDFWFAPCDPLSVALCRIGVATLLLVSLASMAPNWERFFAADGVLSLRDLDLDPRRPRYGWNVFAWSEGVVPVSLWWWFGVASTTSLLCGWNTRLASIGCYVMTCSVVHRDPIIVNGEDLIARFLLLYGMFCPWGDALSIDAWRRQRTRPDEALSPKPVWAVRLMQIHVMLIYAISLPYKFAQDISWYHGDAMHWTIASDMWWMRDFHSELTLSFGGWIRKALTWGTVAVEAFIPLGVCFRRLRLPAILLMVSLHVGIATMIPGVTLFTLSMVVGATLYLDGAQVRAAVAIARRWLTTGAPFRECATDVKARPTPA